MVGNRRILRGERGVLGKDMVEDGKRKRERGIPFRMKVRRVLDGTAVAGKVNEWCYTE